MVAGQVNPLSDQGVFYLTADEKGEAEILVGVKEPQEIQSIPKS